MPSCSRLTKREHESRSLRLRVDETEVSALLERPADALVGYVFAHGAGAGMYHVFMEDMAQRLAALGVATFRFQFPYTETGKKRPDPSKTLQATVRAAVAAARASWPDLPLIAGGKSMGGRMSSLCQAQEPLLGVLGLAFLGFPLHAPKKPATARADHLRAIDCPMLFLQGTRDTLTELSLFAPIVETLPTATMQVVDGADHSLAVLKRSGRSDNDVKDEVAGAVASWARSLVPSASRKRRA